MVEPSTNNLSFSLPSLLRAGMDQFEETRSLGVSTIQFKVTPSTSTGTFIIENTFHQKGGPARHLHFYQDEWFFITQGEFVFEVGEQRFTLHSGDSLLAPRNVPHVWACNQAEGGSILIAFFPAGKMPTFFREVTKTNAMPVQDPALWQAHDMKLIGPPLSI